MGRPNAALGDPFAGSEITTILVTSDLEESKRFYLDVLGAEVRCFFRDPDGCLFEISEYRGG